MTTPAHEAEADRVELVYYYALTQIGVHTIDDALSLWSDVPLAGTQATSARWLGTAVKLVMLRRSRARDLALAYYRLVRALRTGRTVRDPRQPRTSTVSLETLRVEFEQIVDEVAPDPAAANPLPERRDTDSTTEPVSTVEPELKPGHDDEPIEVDEIDNLEDLADSLELEAEQEAKLVLEALGTANLEDKVSKLDQEQPAKEVDAQSNVIHLDAGVRQAAAAERISLNAARGFVYSVGSNDPKVVGWVRYSQTGTPCGWCAMLISRGLIFYSSAEAAQHQGKDADEDKYHDNCHCVAVPVFSREQYEKSDLFALNREYDHLWQNGDKDRGLRARPSLTDWRRYFRRLQQENDVPAQAAAA